MTNIEVTVEGESDVQLYQENVPYAFFQLSFFSSLSAFNYFSVLFSKKLIKTVQAAIILMCLLYL